MTQNKFFLGKEAFTLVEVLVTLFIAALIFIAAWAVYVMGWTWWYEVSPRIEAQRIARIAITRIIEGMPDSTTGQDVIGSSAYKRRSGIAYTYFFQPVLSSDRIDYGLFEDYLTSTPSRYKPSAPRNVRSFYLGTDAATGLKAVYYKDGHGSVHKIESTSGISDLKFNKYVDSEGTTYDYIVAVTATVERDMASGGGSPYHIKVEYSDYAYLKNVQ